MRYFLFGDSIGFGTGDFEKGGWATQLRLLIDRNQKKDHTLTNLSVAGDTTRELLIRLEQETKVRIRPGETKDNYTLLLAIGTNDARIDKINESRNILQEEYESNIRKLISIAENYFAHITLIGLPPVDEKRTTPFKEQNFYTNDNLGAYENILKNVAGDSGCQFVPLFEMWKNKDTAELMYDGLHPNTQGHELIYQEIRSHLFS
jgi:lysophospholipase L1-like esterase